MKISYTLTEKDYVRAVRLGAKFSMKTLALMGLLFILLGGSFYLIDQNVSFAVSLAVAFAAALLVVRVIVVPWTARNNYRKYKTAQEPFELELKPDGVEMTNADGGGLVRWDKLYQWRHNKHCVLIYLMPRLYYVIPAHVEEKGFDLETLKRQLEHHLGEAR